MGNFATVNGRMGGLSVLLCGYGYDRLPQVHLYLIGSGWVGSSYGALGKYIPPPPLREREEVVVVVCLPVN